VLSTTLGPDLLGLPVLHADNRLLPGSTPPFQLAALRGRHVLPLAAHERLVGLYRPLKRLVGRIAYEAFADALHEIPRRLLRDAKLPVKLHAGRALEASDHHVDSKEPLLVADPGTLHHRTLLH